MNNNTKHTPAPWFVDYPNVSTQKGNHICRFDVSNFIPEERKQANARLIAAAPCLLSALKRLVAAEDATIGEFEEPQINELESAMDEALEIISKAEGTTNEL